MFFTTKITLCCLQKGQMRKWKSHTTFIYGIWHLLLSCLSPQTCIWVSSVQLGIQIAYTMVGLWYLYYFTLYTIYYLYYINIFL